MSNSQSTFPGIEAEADAAAPDVQSCTAGRRPGRPLVDSRENRLNRLLDSAAALLRSGDYGALTIDAIAKGAGMGKKTLYALVKSKEELITGVILRDVSTLDLLLDDRVENAEQAVRELHKFMSAWARLALGPVGVGIYFMAVANRDTAPALASILETQGLSHALSVLRAWLEKATVRQFFAIQDMEEALALASSLLITQPYWTASLRPGGQLTEAEIDNAVARTVNIFVHSYRQGAR